MNPAKARAGKATADTHIPVPTSATFPLQISQPRAGRDHSIKEEPTTGVRGLLWKGTLNHPRSCLPGTTREKRVLLLPSWPHPKGIITSCHPKSPHQVVSLPPVQGCWSSGTHTRAAPLPLTAAADPWKVLPRAASKEVSGVGEPVAGACPGSPSRHCPSPAKWGSAPGRVPRTGTIPSLTRGRRTASTAAGKLLRRDGGGSPQASRG